MKSSRAHAAFTALGLTGALLVGCSGATDVGSIFVKSASVPATQGATITVSKEESATLAGASLQIYGRSLSADATLHVALGKSDLAGSDETAAGPVVQWTPAELTFSTPALMTLPVKLPQNGGGIAALEVELQGVNGERSSALPSSVTVSADATLVQFYVSSLGSFQPVVAKACVTSATCKNGRVCIEGFCRRPDALDGGYPGSDGGTWYPDGGFTPPDGGDVEDAGIHDGGSAPDGGIWIDDGGIWAVDGGSWFEDGGVWVGDGGHWSQDGGIGGRDGG